MSVESKKEIQLEIAHVLFIDIVGYSKLSITDEHATVEELNRIVRVSEQFQRAEAANRLIRIPTGDGMALVFYTSPEAPAHCAVEISRALKEHPRLQLRMGIHSGPVSGVVDVNERANLAGAGINMAKRVMDCGDAGHILLSKHVAEDLEEYEKWRPFLHDLGTCEAKHGVRVSVVNLCDDQFGNAKLPLRFETAQKRRARVRWAEVAVALLVLAAIIAGFVLLLRRPARSALAIAEKSIAVLPFENLSRDPDNAYFADGIQDEILTRLSKIADLKVISRTSTQHYKSAPENLPEIAKQLGVAHILEGSVQRAGNRVRVTAQLIDGRTDTHLWGEGYDRDLADVFAIQSEIARKIADQLQAKLSPSEKSAIERPATSDLTAFELYTQARNLLSAPIFSTTGDANLAQAVDLLNQAVARDPSFFQAYCQLAYAHDLVYFLGNDRTPERLAMADAAIQAASRLFPDAGETHLARAENLYRGYLDYDGALAELEVAVGTLPNDPRVFELQGYVQRRQGRWEEAMRNLERAADLDPRNVFTLEQTALSYQLLRRYAEAESVLDRISTIEPNNLEIKAARAFVELDWKADTRPLRQLIDKIRATNPGATQSIANYWLFCALADRDAVGANNALIAAGKNPIILANENIVFNRPFAEGVIARMTNDDAKARSALTDARTEQEKIIQAQPNYGPALCVLGLIDAGLRRKEEALREGLRAVELLSVKKDALGGAEIVKYLAIIAAWADDKDLACEQLAIVINRPSPISYGQLKLLPFWDPLRGDPRFEKIVASLAPKTPDK